MSGWTKTPNAILEKYGGCSVSTFTADIIEEWFVMLEDRKGYSEGHLAFHRSCHATFWRWCGMDIVKIARYSEVPAVMVLASDTQIRALLHTCSHMWDTIHRQRDAAIVALGTSGLRRSNIERARTSEALYALNNPVVHDGHNYYILRTKGKEPMEAILDEQRATRRIAIITR